MGIGPLIIVITPEAVIVAAALWALAGLARQLVRGRVKAWKERTP